MFLIEKTNNRFMRLIQSARSVKLNVRNQQNNLTIMKNLLRFVPTAPF